MLANTPEIEPNGLAHQIAEWALGLEQQPNEDDPQEPAPPDVSALVGTYRDGTGRSVTA